VTFLDERTLWGKILYAPTEAEEVNVDALSAALMVKATRAARQIRGGNDALVELEFHLTSWQGAYWSERSSWRPQPGEIVKVHLNSDYALVSVRYA